MSRYRIEHDGVAVEVITHLNNRCELLVDGRQVDSGSMAAMGGTIKLMDTSSDVVVNVTTGSSLHPRVALLADGRELPANCQ